MATVLTDQVSLAPVNCLPYPRHGISDPRPQPTLSHPTDTPAPERQPESEPSRCPKRKKKCRTRTAASAPPPAAVKTELASGSSTLALVSFRASLLRRRCRVKRRRALRGRNLSRDNPADGVPPGTWLRGSNHARGVFFLPPGGHQSHALKIHPYLARLQHPITSACLTLHHRPFRFDRLALALPSVLARLGSSGCSTPRSRCDAPADRSRPPSSSGP